MILTVLRAADSLRHPTIHEVAVRILSPMASHVN